MRSKQVNDRRGCLHRVIEIMKRSVAGKKSRVAPVKKFEGKGYKPAREMRSRFAEDVSYGTVGEFHGCVKTLGMEHSFGVIHGAPAPRAEEHKFG